MNIRKKSLPVEVQYAKSTVYHLHSVHDRPFVTCMSRRTQSDRRTSFGIPVWFIGSAHSLHYVYVFIFI